MEVGVKTEKRMMYDEEGLSVYKMLSLGPLQTV